MGLDCRGYPHTHESIASKAARLLLLDNTLRSGARVLSSVELAQLLPPRNPAGCPQNQERGRVLRILGDAGFMVTRKARAVVECELA
jgi:hypothetical protein